MSRNSRLENASNAEIDAVLSELEAKLDRLKVSYERYFSGIDRTPPEFLRKDVVRILRMLENSFIRNTAQKFRLNTCSQKLSTYSTYWNRIQRQIEEGTFKRDVQKARRNEQRRARQTERDDEPKDDVYELDMDANFDEDEFLSSFQNEFADALDTLFDRDTGPTTISPSAFSRDQQAPTTRTPGPFDRQNEGPTTIAPGGFDRSQQAPTTIAPGGFDRSQQAPTTIAPGGFTTPENTEAAERQSKLDAMRRRLEERRPATGNAPAPTGFSREEQPATRIASSEVPGMPTGGADYDKLRKLRQMKERLEEQQATAPPAQTPQPRVVQRSAGHPTPTPASVTATGPQRVIQRRTPPAQPTQPSARDEARDVYNKLVEAKQRCNEPTANLTFESVQRSMEQQRDRLRQSHGARDVDFQVVIKDGKAYLKPETKK